MGKTLYLECYSGISGDMTVAALIDLGVDINLLKKTLDSLNIDGYEIKVSRVKKSGLDVCDFSVILDKKYENHDHNIEYLHAHKAIDINSDTHRKKHEIYGEHEHRGIVEIRNIILSSSMTDNAKKIALHIFELLAEAEACAHGIEKEEVHFHEVGAVDSIIDIAATAICLDLLDITEVIIPQLYEGTGTVYCQHGEIPIPVPAVVSLIQKKQIKLKITDIKGELVTPTGAAIVAAIQTSDMLPEKFTIVKTGVGAGKRAYECVGVLRAMWIVPEIKLKNNIWKLETNIDDSTGEELGNIMNHLFNAGAKDVYYTPVFMKKNRPAWLLSIICKEEKIPEMEEIIFRQTTTIGIRKNYMESSILKSEIQNVVLQDRLLKVKICTLPDGSKKCYPEYESVVCFAEENHMSYREAWEKIKMKWTEKFLL